MGDVSTQIVFKQKKRAMLDCSQIKKLIKVRFTVSQAEYKQNWSFLELDKSSKTIHNYGAYILL